MVKESPISPVDRALSRINQPHTIIVCCRTCYHHKWDASIGHYCENYTFPDELSSIGYTKPNPKPIPMLTESLDSLEGIPAWMRRSKGGLLDCMYCHSWKELNLVDLIVKGYSPNAISVSRRFPITKIPSRGYTVFCGWLQYVIDARREQSAETSD